MCEILIKVRDYVNADPVKDRRGVHKKGDIINVKPDGWSDHPNWAQSAYPYANGGKFVLVKVPGLAVETVLNYRTEWRDNFAYEVLSSNAQQGRYTVRVYETNAGASNQNGLTAAKVELFLTGWGCTNIAFTTNSCEFTFSLWNAVRSPEFWDAPLIATKVVFNLNSYTPITGIAVIGIAPIVSAWTEFDELLTEVKQEEISNVIVSKIEERGGTMVDVPNLIFEIERSNILQRFRDDVKLKAEQTYMRHSYAVSAAEVDTIIAAGGVMTITQAQLASRLRDKQAE